MREQRAVVVAGLVVAAFGTLAFRAAEWGARTPDVRYGIVFHAPYQDQTHLNNAASVTAAAGIRSARVTVYWNMLQQAFGGLNVDSVNKVHVLLQAVHNSGMTAFVTLERTPCFAKDALYNAYDPGCAGPDNQNYVPDITAWTNYVSAFVNAFPASEAPIVGIWNEPNGGFLVPIPGARRDTIYPKLVTAAAPILHAAGRMVVAPDIADADDATSGGKNKFQWFSDFLATSAASQVDAYAVHVYNDPYTDILPTMQQFANLESTAGKSQSIWLTETGLKNASDDCQQLNDMASKTQRLDNYGSTVNWSRTFYYDAGGVPSGIVLDLGGASTTRPAYDWLKWWTHRPGSAPVFNCPPAP